MTNVTALEKALLWNLAHSEYTAWNGAEPENFSKGSIHTYSWGLLGGEINKRNVSGVVSSCVKKGWVVCTDAGTGDAVTTMTEEGFTVYQRAFKKGPFAQDDFDGQPEQAPANPSAHLAPRIIWAAENKKRGASAQRYESMVSYLKEHPEATVEEILKNTSYTRADLRWDVAKGFVKLG